ncbi:MAG: MBL fold metallo-hydrolase [Burkholderiales bacterium]|nr:MBL fold metallo-hydrolase [Burkholderiales bacterium]
MPTTIPFLREFEPAYGTLVPVSPLIRRLVAANSGPFTAWGTGTYVVGRGQVAVIDPGPDDPSHVAALESALGAETVIALVITHTHMDHSPAAATLKKRWRAPTIGCGPHGARGETTEAGADYDYRPDRQLVDGETVAGPGWTLTAVATPGHTSNHLCFCLEEESALFTGDHVMGWSTTVVSPPDGDMSAYMQSLNKVLARGDAILYPTHGAPITAPRPFVEALIAHRLEREAQVLDCLGAGIEQIPAMVAKLYADVDPRLHRAAGRSLLSHLLKLIDEGRVRRDAESATARDDTRGRFSLA